ncbi:hypothetical protein LEMLEM_LOCUS24730, partial [Lemmus lemmus]
MSGHGSVQFFISMFHVRSRVCAVLYLHVPCQGMGLCSSLSPCSMLGHGSVQFFISMFHVRAWVCAVL